MIVLFSLLFLSCNEDNPTEPGENYTGITQTDAAGNQIGEIDMDDWYYEPDTSDQGIGIPLKFSVFPAYPNPTTRYTSIIIATPEYDSVKVWIDDPMSNKQTVIVNRALSAGVHKIKIDLYYGDDNYESQTGIVRAFIDFVNIADLPLIHGDIQIIK